jgi:hypothetical protein
VYITDTTNTPGSFGVIQCLADTVFETLTNTTGTGAITGITIPAGLCLYGNFTVVKLTSGKVCAYKNQ